MPQIEPHEPADLHDDADVPPIISAIAAVMGPPASDREPQLGGGWISGPCHPARASDPTAVRDAITALNHFGASDRATAVILLSMWRHRERLDAAGMLAALAQFSAGSES
jgi:hypothetical protein